MLSFVEHEKRGSEREWEKRTCVMPSQQENSDAVQVQERLQMKFKELYIYCLETMFANMSLGVTHGVFIHQYRLLIRRIAAMRTTANEHKKEQIK